MRYIFLIYSQESPDGPSPDTVSELMAGHRAVIAESASKGVLRGLDPLKPTSTATTVRMSDGKALITDGPFAETKEQLAGYYIMECANLDEAIGWAQKIPTTCKGDSGCIEIRPIVDIPKPV
jgi:hypothetical protein